MLTLMDSKKTSGKTTNFIRNVIDEDLSTGEHKTVVTRFPPEPNGYLHIGHAKSICLNFGTASDYDGYCNLRFDDTNPSKEDIEYVNSIKNDVNWLGFSWDKKVKFSSDYFDIFYECAIELIKKELAYVCFLSAEETREYRGTLKKPGKNSPYRNSSVEENLSLFAKMKEGEFEEGKCVLRAKIDMASNFMCMRDPTLYRIRFETHHQTKDKYIRAFTSPEILSIYFERAEKQRRVNPNYFSNINVTKVVKLDDTLFQVHYYTFIKPSYKQQRQFKKEMIATLRYRLADLPEYDMRLKIKNFGLINPLKIELAVYTTALRLS